MNRGGGWERDEISALDTERQRRKQTKRDSRAKSNNANNNVKDSLFFPRKHSSAVLSSFCERIEHTQLAVG